MPNAQGIGLVQTLDDWIRRADAHIVITRTDEHGGLWNLLATFGREAEDSPMAGGSLIGSDESLVKCVEQALADAGVNPCATCGWDQSCEEGCAATPDGPT